MIVLLIIYLWALNSINPFNALQLIYLFIYDVRTYILRKYDLRNMTMGSQKTMYDLTSGLQ